MPNQEKSCIMDVMDVGGEQTASFLHRFYEVFPQEIAENLDKTRVGMGAVIRMLYEEKDPVTAGDIANQLEISTARVAVVIKNMESKGLVAKTKDPNDRRVTLVGLTEKGRNIYETHQERFLKCIRTVIDEVGQERLDQFFEIADQMKEIFYRETHSC